MARDEMEVRRWFRQRLKAIADSYPELTDPVHQAACDRWLKEEEYIEHTTTKESDGQAEGERPI
jgi:hypothetical protein